MNDFALFITPYSSEILGADKNYLYIKEHYFPNCENDEDELCIIVISIKEYLVLCEKWIRTKADYCSRFGHWCGVFGSFQILNYEKTGEATTLIDINPDNLTPVYKKLPIFNVLKVDDICDMEHG